MPNMSYCRFENTLRALRDCFNHMDDEDLSEEEESARIELIQTSKLVAEYGETEDDES